MAHSNHCGERAFPEGITNGAQWYTQYPELFLNDDDALVIRRYDVPGGMQDFNYRHSNDFDITLELSCCKHPDASTLPKEWLDNKESLIAYIEQAHIGIKGLVVDANGQPVPNARVSFWSIKWI